MPAEEAVLEEVAETPEEVVADEPAGIEPPPDTTDVEEPAEEPAEEETEEAPAEEKTETQDGRKMPDALRKAISAAKEVPGAAGAIRDLYFKNQAYEATFPKVEEAVAAKTLIDEVGGPEGIQAIHAEREEWAEIDRSFSEGSQDFVKSLAEGNTEAFMKIAPHVINEFAQRNPDQYDYYTNNLAVNKLMSQPGVEAGFTQLRALYDQLGEAPWAQQAIASVINGVVGLKEKAATFEQKRVDPQVEQLKKDRENFENERRGNFEKDVADQSENYLNTSMKPEIDKVLAGRKVDDEAYSSIRDMVNKEVQRRLGEVPNFANQLEAHYRTGDRGKSIEYIKTQYNRILPEAVKKVVGPLYRNIAAPPAPRVAPRPGAPKPTGNASPGTVTLKEMPSRADLDPAWASSPEATLSLMQGKALLKSGKWASGWM